MKIFNFHLMPYADADLDAIGRHGTAWVTFSNSQYDPKKGAELYHRYLDELEYADKLGFDGVVLNEHHQNAYGLMPTPGVLAGALARSVKKRTRSRSSAAPCRSCRTRSPWPRNSRSSTI